MLVCLGAFVMVYPLLWLLGSSFKETNTIFNTAGELIPRKIVLQNYVNGWHGFAKITFGTFFKNSAFISVTATVGTLISSAFVAYSFARCKFKGKKILFAAMLVSMMLPAQILMIPQYLWYQKLGWIGSYLPLIVPYCFATQGFFIYLMMNFINGVPKELDEAAKIDGATNRQLLRHVTIPMVMPSITICTFLTLTNSFKLFDQNLALTAGEPSNSSQMLALNIYETFYTRTGWEGAGQAKAVVFFIIVAVIAMLQNRLTRSKEVQQ